MEEIVGQKVESKYPVFLQEATEKAWQKLLEPTPPSKLIKRYNFDVGRFHLSAGYALFNWGLGINIEGSGLKDWELVIRILPLFVEFGVYGG